MKNVEIMASLAKHLSRYKRSIEVSFISVSYKDIGFTPLHCTGTSQLMIAVLRQTNIAAMKIEKPRLYYDNPNIM